MSYPIAKLGEIVRIRTGKLDANASSENGKYYFFTCAKEPLKIDSYSYDCECVLIAGNGDLNVKYYNGKFDAYQRTYIVESLDQNNLNMRYLFHFIDKYLIKLREQSIGGIIKYIKLSNLTDIQIPLPPLEEQRRIAEILDKADGLIQNRKKAIEKLDELLQATFIDMFGDPVTNPKNWKQENLENISQFENGDRSSNYPSGNDLVAQGIPFLSTKNIINNNYDENSLQFISKEKFTSLTRGKVKNGDILITLRGTLGSTCVFRSKYNTAFINAQMMIIRSKDQIIAKNYFLYSIFSSPRMKQYFQSIGQGAAVPQLTATQLKSLKIILPPIILQNKWEGFAAVVEEQKKKMQEQLEVQETLFKSLQQQAFSGQL